MMTLQEAIAEVKGGNVRRWGGVDTKPEAVATIINAAASGNLIPVQCCMCGKKDLSIVEGDGGQECELADGRWTCSSDCWEKATADLIPKADHDLAEARDKALEEAQLAAQQCLIDLAHSAGGHMERRASTLFAAETHVSFAIRNLKGPTP
jgi:hypothetical protein